MAIIGVDIEGTIAGGFNSVNKIQPPTEKGVHLLKKIKENGHTICLFSCKPTHVISKWLQEYGLESLVDYINESPLPTDDLKPCFHAYIGDEAISWNENPEEVLVSVTKKLGQINTKMYSRDKEYCDRPLKLFHQGTGTRFLDMFEDHWKQFWPGDIKNRILFLTTCSHAKPYSKSYIHMSIRKRLHNIGVLDRIDYGHISGSGIVLTKRGYEYPYNAYDMNYAESSELGRLNLRKKIERDLKWLFPLVTTRYEKIVIYLRAEGNTYTAITNILPNYAYAKFIRADCESISWADDHDPDNCLTTDKNLLKLSSNEFA